MVTANCEFSPRVIIPRPNKYLYVKISGGIVKHSSRLANGTFRTVSTGLRCETSNRIRVHTALYSALICPYEKSSRQHLVEVFSEGWNIKKSPDHAVGQMALDRIEIDRLGKELPRTIVVEFYGKQTGEYSVMWLELSRRSRMFLLIENYPDSKDGKFTINKNMSETQKKLSRIDSAAWEIRRDVPPNGMGLFMMKPDECQYRCPELDACINATVWCDGIEDCPSGVDEALTHCSLLFQLPQCIFFSELWVLLFQVTCFSGVSGSTIRDNYEDACPKPRRAKLGGGGAVIDPGNLINST
ncbi:hypothetical protein NQ317_019498 [Molorchus minor]|uniref:DUF7805 domain-containing protein n=1 Tax=Molorchus minor TaxID=1323400 RepID=A0ABQ9JA28_9CUCU|nr:hypothetical protein NQ317_019498 [Molorchus minor]